MRVIVSIPNAAERWLKPVSLQTETSQFFIIGSISLIDKLSNGIHKFFNSDFKIYPNPVRMKEKVYISNKYIVDEINIYNQLGKLISTNKYNSNNIIVDISNFTSGIYFVSIKDQTGIKTRTIVLENE